MTEVLERFYAFVCKQDGTDYEPGSLTLLIIEPPSPENGGQKAEGQGSSKLSGHVYNFHNCNVVINQGYAGQANASCTTSRNV